jgi:O-antigen/teichoic acid export membrane protein
MIWGVFTWVQLSSDRWALSIYSSASNVGLFTVVYQLGYYPISFLSGIFLQFISPILFQWTGDATEKNRTQKSSLFIRNLVIYSIIFGVVFALLTLAFHKQIFTLLVAPQYRQVSYLLPWMVLSGCIFASGQFSAIHYLNLISPKRLLVPKILTAVLGVALNFLFARLFGLTGIIAASLVFSTLYLILILLLPKTKLGGISV